MQLYYTTSAGYEQPQPVVARSTGGYRSSNIVKNNDFDNLFGEISNYTIRESRDTYIALILRNTTGSTVNNVEAWFVSDANNYGTLQIAPVATTMDAENNPIMERTRTPFTQPFVGTFVDATDATRRLLGTLNNNAELGIWIKRSINRTVVDQTIANIYERDPNNTDIYREIALNQTETHSFRIEWT